MKDTVIFDTHKVIKRFVAVGFTEEQAEVVCQEQKQIIEHNLATKQDIAEINFKIENLRQETKQDIAEINFKMEILKKDIAQIDFKIENLRQEMKKDIEIATKKMYIALFSSMFGSIGFFVTLLKVLQLLKL